MVYSSMTDWKTNGHYVFCECLHFAEGFLVPVPRLHSRTSCHSVSADSESSQSAHHRRLRPALGRGTDPQILQSTWNNLILGTPRYSKLKLRRPQLLTKFHIKIGYGFNNFDSMKIMGSDVTSRVVKTAHSFWPVNRDQKDRLTGLTAAAAYAAPAAIVPHAGLPVVLHSLQ